MPETDDHTPSAIRRLDSPGATRLARLVGAYDDLQTMLRCCERLLTTLGARPGPGGAVAGDDPGVEALWTLALLCYGRAFGTGEEAPPLTEADLVLNGDEEVVRSHRVLMHLRDHHADTATNPRESYSVGVAQDAAGAVNGIAVTSHHTPSLDREAVRRAGAMVIPLCAVLDDRIAALHREILEQVRDTPVLELARMDLIEVAATGS